MAERGFVFHAGAQILRIEKSFITLTGLTWAPVNLLRGPLGTIHLTYLYNRDTFELSIFNR